MANNKEVFFTCRKDSGVKLQTCESCKKHYHTNCTKLQTILNSAGNKTKMCQACLAVINVPPLGVKTRTSSMSSQGSGSRPSSPLQLPTSDLALKAILAKLDIIDKRTLNIETDTTAKLAAMAGKIDAFQADLTGVATKLTLLDQLPALVQKVTEVEDGMAAMGNRMVALEAEQSDIWVSLATLGTIGVTEAADNAAKDNEQIKTTVALLESRLDQLSLAGNANALSNGRSSSTSHHEVTVSGLTLGTVAEASLLRITEAVAKAIKVDIHPGELLSARVLRKPRPPPTIDEPVFSTRITFAVVCSNSSIVSRLLAAKRSFGALKLSQLDRSSFPDEDLDAEQLGDPFININELLPSTVFHLLKESKIRLKAVGFKYVWTRNFIVYTKFKDDSVVQIINTLADNPRIALLYSNPRAHQDPVGHEQQ